MPEPATSLRRALSTGHAPKRPTVLDAFAVARRCFAAGRRIDMQAVADELSINRTTLYRWVGSREQLITEVLWEATRRTFARYQEQYPELPRAASDLGRFVADVNRHRGMQQLLDDEAQFALTLLTSTSGDYQHRYLELVGELISQDRATGTVSTEIPLDDLAYTAVRITESYIHARVIADLVPDAERAAAVLRVLLR